MGGHPSWPAHYIVPVYNIYRIYFCGFDLWLPIHKCELLFEKEGMKKP